MKEKATESIRIVKLYVWSKFLGPLPSLRQITDGGFAYYSVVKINCLLKAVMLYGVPISKPTFPSQCPLRLIQGICHQAPPRFCVAGLDASLLWRGRLSKHGSALQLEVHPSSEFDHW